MACPDTLPIIKPRLAAKCLAQRTQKSYVYTTTATSMKSQLNPIPLSTSQTTRRFEPPDYRQFAIHCACCALIYPILQGSVLIAHMRSINAVRTIVAAGCMIINLIMTLSLHALARRFVETASK